MSSRSAHAAAGVLGTFPYDLAMVEVPGKDRTLHRRVGRGDRNDSQHQRRGRNDCAGHRLETGRRGAALRQRVSRQRRRVARAAPARSRRSAAAVDAGTLDAGTIAARDHRRARGSSPARGSPTSTAIVTISRGWLRSRTRPAHFSASTRCKVWARCRSTCALWTSTRSIAARQNGCSDCTARHFSTSARVSRAISRSPCPGWRSLEDMWDFHNYEQPFTREALRFEGGTPNLLGTLSLACAIDLFNASGPERDRRACVDAHRPALRRPCGAWGHLLDAAKRALFLRHRHLRSSGPR